MPGSRVMTLAGPHATPAPMQRSRGIGRLGVKLRGERTCLDTFYQEGCCKMRLPRAHGQAREAVLINTAGGITGGDAIDWEADAAPGTRLVLTTQACERVYRSTGDDARVTTALHVGAGAHVDWLPQETILFEKSRLDRALTVHLAAGATFMAVEAVLLGRDAMGETARAARLKDRWKINREGQLIHAEATRLAGTDRERDGLSLLAGHNAFATLLAITPDAGRKLELLRDMLGPEAMASASAVGERLTLRVLASSGFALRRTLSPAIALLSGTGALPRLWTI